MARPKGFSSGFAKGFGAFTATAELMIKVGDSVNPDGFKDGDVMCAFPRKRIRGVHAEHICWGRNGEGKKLGGRLDNTLLEKFLENIYQYKFERISETEVRRTNLVTSAEDICSDDSQDADTRMDVAGYVSRRVAAGKKPMFGAEGSERWYGGKTVADHDTLDTIWDEIELQTANKEEDHLRWPGTSSEKKNYLFVSVNDMTDAEAGELTEPDLDLTDPDNPVTRKRRKRQVEWRKLRDVDKNHVLDKGREVDIRGRKEIINSIVKVKT